MIVFYNNIFLHSIIMSLVVIGTLLLIYFVEKKYSARATYTFIIIVLLFSILPIRFGTLQIPINHDIGHEVIANYSSEVPYLSDSTNNISSIIFYTILMIIWVIGIIVSLLIRLHSYNRFKQTLTRWWRPNTKSTYDEVLQQVKEELDIQKADLEIKIFPLTNTPMLIGVLKQVIVLPHDNYDEEEIYYILKHECVHYKRKDTIVRLLSLINLSIHWFNPLMYILNKQLIIQCEKACDEEVVKGRSKEEKIKYAEVIINSIENTMYKKTQLSTQFLGRSKDIKDRLALIFKERKVNKSVVITLVSLFTILLVFSSSIFAYNKDNITNNFNNIENATKSNPINEQETKKRELDINKLKEIALQHTKGGKIVEIEQGYDNGRYRIEFEIINQDYEYSIDLDVQTGEVLEFESESIYD